MQTSIIILVVLLGLATTALISAGIVLALNTLFPAVALAYSFQNILSAWFLSIFVPAYVGKITNVK